MSPLLELQSPTLHYATTSLSNPHCVEIPEGITAVIGPNGAGKSLLGNIIAHGRNFRTNRILTRPSFKVHKVEFSDIHSLRGLTGGGYYQQRYEATMNDEVPTVSSILPTGTDMMTLVTRCNALGLDGVMDKRINYLSSGELRKLLIALALNDHPDLLILDNPYIGLDVQSRAILDEAITSLAANGTNIMLLLCDPADIPLGTGTIVPVTDMTIGLPIAAGADLEEIKRSLLPMFTYDIDCTLLPPPPVSDTAPVEVIARFTDCRIAHGNRTLIDCFNWTIGDNQRWSLSGPNGSGKSTLLSLINADNPAGYRSDITLFDRRRGSGESIWDIKRRIGYVSPEMRLYFTGTGDVTSTIGRGLIDTVGNYVRLTPQQTRQADAWINLLHLEHLAKQPYNTLSAGQRQLTLVARAMVKQPRLLILDEPMHGIDIGRKQAIRQLIDHMARRADSDDPANPMSMIYVTHNADEVPGCITHTLTLCN